MHAYVHGWACQLIYNPRLQEGFGLTDGEGSERIWSRLRKLIGIGRSCAVCFPKAMSISTNPYPSFQRSKRIWLIDRLAAFINTELRDDLGNWIRRRMKKGVSGQGKEAERVLVDCGISLDELREQWTLQKTAQLSLRACK